VGERMTEFSFLGELSFDDVHLKSKPHQKLPKFIMRSVYKPVVQQKR